MEQHCKQPDEFVEFYEDDVVSQITGKKERIIKKRRVGRRDNCWAICKTPHKNHDYVGFADVAEGMLSDVNDPHSDPDRSVACIMDRTVNDIPATYYGRPDTIEYADQFLLACKYYNWAWASPEMNSIGQSVLDTMKRADYPYIYIRETKEEEDIRVDSKKLGWKTTILTRKAMIVDLQQVVKEHVLRVYDIRFLAELRMFIWNPQGKPEAGKGEHDDCVICLAGVTQLHLRCPIGSNNSYLANESSGPTEAINIAGGYDDMSDMDGFDNDGDGLDALYEDMSDYE
jgi:hypothetical protein